MQKFQDVVLDSQGRPVAGAVIAVQSSPGDSPATVYQSNAIGDAYVPTTDSLGGFFFYAPNGRYNYTVTVAGVLRKTVTDILLEDLQVDPTFGGIVNANGIKFPAIQVPSSDVNVLDDYEEGTWTPVDESGASLSLTASDCIYTKVGRVVHIQGVIVYPATASGTSARIGGLPFATRSGTRTAIEIGGYTNAGIDLAGYSVAANASFIVYTRGTITAVTNLQLSNFGFAINATYEV